MPKKTGVLCGVSAPWSYFADGASVPETREARGKSKKPMFSLIIKNYSQFKKKIRNKNKGKKYFCINKIQ